MKEFFLCPFLVFQKLNIIDDQTVNGAVFFLKILDGMVLNSIDDFIGKGFAGHIFDFCTGIHFQNSIADGVHQMCFSQTGIPINKQRVVHIAGIFGNCLGRCCGKAVGIAYYKSFKTLFFIDVAFERRIFRFFIFTEQGFCFICFFGNIQAVMIFYIKFHLYVIIIGNFFQCS